MCFQAQQNRHCASVNFFLHMSSGGGWEGGGEEGGWVVKDDLQNRKKGGIRRKEMWIYRQRREQGKIARKEKERRS